MRHFFQINPWAKTALAARALHGIWLTPYFFLRKATAWWLVWRGLASRRLAAEGDWSNLARQFADVLELVLRNNEPYNATLLKCVIEQAPLSVSQAVLTEAASNLGKWGSLAENENSPLISDVQVYEALLAGWLKRVEDEFNSAVPLEREPLVYTVLYRLGGLGGDYSIARKIAKKLVEGGDLPRFMRSTQLSGEARTTFGHLDIVWDREELLRVIEREEKYKVRYQNAASILGKDKIIKYFDTRSAGPFTG